MKKTLGKILFVIFLCGIVFSNASIFTVSAKQNSEVATEITATNEELKKIAQEAYIYGLSLVEMERSKYQMTHSQYEGDIEWAQLGSYYHVRNFADPSTTRLRAPNIDVLYSGAWVNLEDEPVVLYVPEMEDRYYSIQINDMYSNISGYIGTRETGSKEGVYALVGPDWNGKIDAKVDGIIEVSTNYTWIFPRTFAKDAEDLKVVHELQDKYRIAPLSKYSKKGLKAFKQTYKQKDRGMQLKEDPYGKIEYFEVLNDILKEIGMPESEKELMERFDSIGIGPNSEFEESALTNEQREIFAKTSVETEQLITFLLNKPSDTVNGWSGSMDVGKFGQNYFLRALCARGGIGGNTAEEAYYPTSYFDGNGGRYNGSNNYTLTFPAGSIPPVEAFWSLTIYDSATHCLVENPIEKYAIRDVDKDLKYNEDGSLTIYIQSEAPVGFEGNWLPSPKDKDFHMIFRAYIPGQEWFTGDYRLPGVQKVN